MKSGNFSDFAQFLLNVYVYGIHIKNFITNLNRKEMVDVNCVCGVSLHSFVIDIWSSAFFNYLIIERTAKGGLIL